MCCLFLATDCNNGDDIPNCELPLDAFSEPTTFQLVSPTGQTLIGEFGTLYENKYVEVEDADGMKPSGLHIGDSGNISFVIPKSNDQIGEPLERSFFLILPPTGNNPLADTDTIKTKYQLLFDNRCNVTWYESMEIRFNDSLYHSGDFPNDIIKFTKF